MRLRRHARTVRSLHWHASSGSRSTFTNTGVPTRETWKLKDESVCVTSVTVGLPDMLDRRADVTDGGSGPVRRAALRQLDIPSCSGRRTTSVPALRGLVAVALPSQLEGPGFHPGEARPDRWPAA